MNVERLLQAKEFLKTVPEERFDISLFRIQDSVNRECGSVGCAMGWLTGMIPEGNILRWNDGNIDFISTGRVFFDLDTHVSGFMGNEFNFLFGSAWAKYNYSKIEDVIDRIDYLIKFGAPLYIKFDKQYKV